MNSSPSPASELKNSAEVHQSESKRESLIERKETETVVGAVQQIAPARRKPWTTLARAVGLLLFGFIVVGAVWNLRVRLNNGVIELSGIPEDARVFVDGDKVTVTTPGEGEPAEITVPPGPHRVEVKKDGFQVWGQEVSLAAGGRMPLVARLIPNDESQPTSGATATGVTSRGSGMGQMMGGGGGMTGGMAEMMRQMRVSMGMGGMSMGGNQSKDPPANDEGMPETMGGMGMRGGGMMGEMMGRMRGQMGGDMSKEAPANGEEAPGMTRGMGGGMRMGGMGMGMGMGGGVSKEAPANGEEAPGMTRGMGGGMGMGMGGLKGGMMRGMMGGNPPKDQPPTPGGMGSMSQKIRGQSKSTKRRTVRGKNVNNSTAKDTHAPTQSQEVFVSLFNGGDLTGWRPNPYTPLKCEVSDGAIRTTSNGRLYTERGDYADFHLRTELMAEANCLGGVFFRSAISDHNESTYAVQINTLEPQGNYPKTGSLNRSVHDPGSTNVLMPVNIDLVRPDEWFILEVIAVGRHFVVKVNGKKVVDVEDPENMYSRGYFALHRDYRSQGGELHCRKFEVKALSGQSMK
jgi:hypothetical protein